MKFISTRGEAPALGFRDAVLAGLASDGGLYLPEEWPHLSGQTIAGFANRPYAEVAFEIIAPFVDGEINDEVLHALLTEAYATFRHQAVTPLRQLASGHFVLELFHGPTLAFKDVAMQFLARVMDHVLAERGARATIVGATSGDTGSAAIEAFRGRENTDIFILHPEGRTSAIQRRQMTTVLDDNVHNVALQGTFDDCQNAVKAMFANARFRDAVSLSGVNSINFGRIVAQIPYYFAAAAALGAPHRPVSFVVPTGNFGDIFAGFAAARMGLPVAQLVIATNENDILRRAVETGVYEMAGVTATTSPSMDIQISSNFERLLFEASNRDAGLVRRQMAALRQSGRFTLEAGQRERIAAQFAAGSASQSDVAATIADARTTSDYLMDPHTAVGAHVAKTYLGAAAPVITLATAHPAKFPDAVLAASGVHPELPDWLADLETRPERVHTLANDQSAIEDFVSARTRAGEEKVT